MDCINVRTITSDLCHETAEDGDQGHEHCEHDYRKKTSNDTENDRGNLQDPLKPREAIREVIDVRDETDEGD